MTHIHHSAKYISTTICLLLLCSISCKKKTDPHVPPEVSFVTASGYTFLDKTVGKRDTLLVGIVAKKTEDDLKSYNASVAYDGATATSTFFNYFMVPAEVNGYTKDLQIITRNQAGTEKWIFSIVDRDGNITQKSFVLTVQ